MESGLGVIDLGGEWYSLHTRVKVRPSEPRQGERRETTQRTKGDAPGCACDRRGLARLLV